MKKKRLIISVVILILVISLALVGWKSFSDYKEKEQAEKLKLKKEKEAKRLADIKSHYYEVVSTTKQCKLYQQKEGKYKEVGVVFPENILLLSKEQDFKSGYFQIEEKDLFVPYQCVSKSEETKIKDTRYQNYIPFPENIKTKNSVTLYQNGKEVYTLSFPINGTVIKKDDSFYYVEYEKELFGIKKEEVEEVIETEENTEYAQEIPVTAYHFIYTEDDNKCQGVICHPVEQIRSQFAYLRNNNYFTITAQEMEEFLDEKIRLPKKSILVTIDDGDRVENVVPLLEEYKINALAFLISAWYSPNRYPQSSYLEFGSHTFELHETGVCSGGQGSPLKCLPTEQLVDDLKKSREVVNQSIAFCFPFYEYNDHAIDAVEKAGFHIAFIGGQKKANIHSNKLLIPRITIYGDNTLEEYINLIS